jgi:hypothetical protein
MIGLVESQVPSYKEILGKLDHNTGNPRLQFRIIIPGISFPGMRKVGPNSTRSLLSNLSMLSPTIRSPSPFST